MSCESCGYGAAAPAPLISAATLDEVGRVAREWPDGIHTCEELQAAEPGRRPCTCGRCPSAQVPAPCWNDFCIATDCDGRHHVDATGRTWDQARGTVYCPAVNGRGQVHGYAHGAGECPEGYESPVTTIYERHQEPALREISAREITAELRLLYPAPVLLSVRADPDAPNVRLGRQFLVRMPEGPSNHMGGWDGLETYLGRHLSQGIAPYPVRVTGRRTVRRRDYGKSHEYTVVLGRL
jgi:hypothetical protein